MIKAEAISKKYNRKTGTSNDFYAVKETDFTLGDGKLAVILGRSGSGKSTFLNMLAGLLEPSSGKVLIDDTDLYSLRDKDRALFRNQKIGVIPQVHSLLANLSVIENVKLPYLLYDPKGDVDAYAEELLDLVQIADLKNVRPSELSGGEMRRAAIARAMIRKPGAILADEPTSDLDDENSEKVFQIFRRIADQGTSIIMVTHETEAVDYADVAYRMNAGELVAIPQQERWKRS